MSTAEITVTRQSIKYTTTLSTLSCGVCEIPFAIPADLLNNLQATGKNFWCPNGHGISYGVTENDRLKKELDAAKRSRDYARAAYDRERDRAAAAERSASAYKGQATRIRKRVGNGLCPCCNRTFVNLQRHMAGQHPGYRDGES